MKKISLLLLLSLLLSSLLVLSSCKKDDTPEGMKLAVPETEGYRFYIPEEWTSYMAGGIATAYISSVNSTSVTYTETAMPKVGVREYFEESLKEFPKAPTITVSGEDCGFGNADSAVKYVYSMTRGDSEYGVMQIFAKYGSRFGIFTYCAEKTSRITGTTLYETNLEKVQSILENFVYLENGIAPEPPAVYSVDAEGWKLVSDKKIAKFSLWIPEDMEATVSSGIVSASYADGSNLSLTRVGAEQITFSDYWAARKAELAADGPVKDFAVVMKETDGEPTEYEKGSLGDLERTAFFYEYTCTYNGEKMHAIQVYGATAFSGFAFTFTAKDENYSLHIDEIYRVIEKIGF